MTTTAVVTEGSSKLPPSESSPLTGTRLELPRLDISFDDFHISDSCLSLPSQLLSKDTNSRLSASDGPSLTSSDINSSSSPSNIASSQSSSDIEKETDQTPGQPPKDLPTPPAKDKVPSSSSPVSSKPTITTTTHHHRESHSSPVSMNTSSTASINTSTTTASHPATDENSNASTSSMAASTPPDGSVSTLGGYPNPQLAALMKQSPPEAPPHMPPHIISQYQQPQLLTSPVYRNSTVRRSMMPTPNLTSHGSVSHRSSSAVNLSLTSPPPLDPRWRARSVYGSVLPSDHSYLPDSSLLAAATAGKKSPSKPQFPPATKQNLSKFRDEAVASKDPQKLLDLAKYLLEAVSQLCVDPNDPQRSQKIKEAMMMEAQKIVKKLANQGGIGKAGYPEAQFFLATCYGVGSMGLQVDVEKAFNLYIQGSKQNHPRCTYRAAVCYEVGSGTKRDKSHAMQFYRKAANLGDPSAMYKLGVILLKGFLGQPKAPREGISWLKRACQQADEDHPHALHELGLAYEKEGIPSVIPDPNYARDLFTQAAQYGYAPSQFKLGLAYENGLLGCPIDSRRSIAWYSKAAEQGDIEAEMALSGWYLTGAEGVLQQSDSEAYLWARKAADRGYAKAEYAVGYYTETGIGVQQNIDEAKQWYMRAAAQRNKRAIQRLAELKKFGTGNPGLRKKAVRGSHGKAHSKDGDCRIM
ncbi:uncharacterized protein BYT42DRAFT_580639 [Radiomyces spectabilis]|uniref:uncharacterized protein n=1 Tax=Radiomyces spectabilis TaxID=64574 RepID=UPI00221FBE40|nr:uncharacterized protein BYT42DRAFT_580639 [Radiomyces spectabilis]KAI8371542.1 hypothetical protein BYT42DRAFT_580639 [Radiomyces spectabilis]